MPGSSILQLPYWALAYLYPGLRQDQNWSYRQAISNSLLKASLHNYTALHMIWPLSLKPRHESERFALIEPASPDLYTGIAADREILPETIGGTWYPDPYSSDAALSDDRFVMLHLHGGSYILGDGRTSSSLYLARTLLKHTPASYALLPQYRLANHANGRFPAQMQDAVSAYAYLVHALQVPPARIVLSGDSSGGHLVLALLRYMAELDDREALPPPRCSLLWSPWCDVPAAVDPSAWHGSENYKTEYIPASFPAWGARRFLGGLEMTEAVERYVAPLRHPFAVPSPVLVITGGKEVLFHDHEQLARDFQAQEGNGSLVELLVERRVPHDILMIGNLLDFREECRECASKAGEFVSRAQPIENAE